MHLIEKDNEILPMVMIDAHVHIYSCFDLQIFFDSAFNNFKSEAAKNGHPDNFRAIVMLTDWAAENWFKYLADYAGGENYTKGKIVKNWTFHKTNESCSLYAKHYKGGGLYVIAGRKIITKENLEVLALITETNFKDGLSLNKTILNIHDKDSIPVIPWAFGKWIGKRGKILMDLIKVTKKPEYLFCDNSNRPYFWPRPSLFRLGELKGIRVIAGSDPLHFASEVFRVGSFGFSFNGSISSKKPASDMKKYLLDSRIQFQVYGKLEKPCRFLCNQMVMQINKKKWRQELTNI